MQVVQSAALPPVVDGFGERYEQFLPIVEVRESERNARKYFSPAKLMELTESIRQHGVIQPVLVRDMPHSGVARYELIDGARRLRAALAAGLRDLPARVLVDCGDREAMELGAVANLQRDDIHPLDEALAFRALIEASGAEVPTVAARVGKPESYVYQRLKLTDLCQKGRELLWADEISIGVALLLAKVSEEHQLDAIDSEWPVEKASELQHWLDTNVYLELSDAPWDKADAELLPSAGSCDACPKRTGFMPALFPEVEDGDTCTDRACFQRKKAAHVERKKAELAEREPDTILVSGEYTSKGGMLDRTKYRELDEEEAADKPEAKRALVVDGYDAGKVIYIEERAFGRDSQSRENKDELKAIRLEEKIKAETTARSVAAVLEAVDISAYTALRYAANWRFIVSRMWERTWSDLRKKIIARRKLPGETSADRVRAMDTWIEQADGTELLELLWELAMGGHSDYSEQAIQQAAALVSVDVGAVAKEVRDELQGGGKPKPKKEAAPPPAQVPPPLPAAARKRIAQAQKKLAAKKAVKKVPPPKKKAAKKKRT